MSDTKKYLKCPDCGSAKTVLYMWPNILAGIWECNNCGVSDNCPHTNTQTEQFTNTTFSPATNYQHDHETQGEVCSDCGVAVL